MRENDKVVILRPGYIGSIGVIDTVISNNLCIVKLDNGELVKCISSDIVLTTKEDKEG